MEREKLELNEKKEVGKENLGEILCKKSQKFGGNKDALKMSL